MKIFDIILFISLLGTATLLFTFDLVGVYGMIILIAIALIGLTPSRVIMSKSGYLIGLLQRIIGKTQR